MENELDDFMNVDDLVGCDELTVTDRNEETCEDKDRFAVDIESIDESKIEYLLHIVRTQYVKLEEENSRLLRLSNLIKEKIENCVEKPVDGKPEPFSFPLNLQLNPLENEEEEEDEDDEE